MNFFKEKHFKKLMLCHHERSTFFYSCYPAVQVSPRPLNLKTPSDVTCITPSLPASLLPASGLLQHNKKIN